MESPRSLWASPDSIWIHKLSKGERHFAFEKGFGKTTEGIHDEDCGWTRGGGNAGPCNHRWMVQKLLPRGQSTRSSDYPSHSSPKTYLIRQITHGPSQSNGARAKPENQNDQTSQRPEIGLKTVVNTPAFQRNFYPLYFISDLVLRFCFPAWNCEIFQTPIFYLNNMKQTIAFSIQRRFPPKTFQLLYAKLTALEHDTDSCRSSEKNIHCVQKINFVRTFLFEGGFQPFFLNFEGDLNPFFTDEKLSERVGRGWVVKIRRS